MGRTARHEPPAARSASRSRLASAALAVALAVVLGPSAAPAAAAPSERFFGISAPELYSMSLDGRYELRDRALERIEAAGISAVRTEIGWRDVEPQMPLAGLHRYTWAAADRHVLALAEHSQELVPMMLAPPAWAQRPEHAGACQRRGMVAPGHVADYAAFTAEVARRYGRGGAFWRWAATERPDLPQVPITTYEIWNEPNWDAFSCPLIDPETYARALAAAADAIHAVDPAAQVTVGGLVLIEADQMEGDRRLGMATPAFLERMVAAVPDLASRVDAVALHTYRDTPAANLHAIGWAHEALERSGLGQERLVVTELGWHTSGSPFAVSENERARMLGEYTAALARTDCPIDAIFPHNWITARSDPNNREDWYGLADPQTAEPLPSGLAYERTVAGADALARLDTLEVCSADAPIVEPPVDPGPSGRLVLRIDKHPKKRASRRPTVRFTVLGAPDARVRARIDRGPWRVASSPLRLRRLSRGRHTVRLRADAPGVAAAKRTLRFRVGPRRR